MGDRVIPELRTSRRFAIVLSGSAVAAIAIALLGSGKLAEAIDSETWATAVLTAWCLLGAGGAIVAIVDAYIQPEGERLELATRVIATVFAVLALLVATGIVVGATDGVSVQDSDEELLSEQ